MALITEEAIDQFQALTEQLDDSLKKTFQNVGQGYPRETLARFLKAMEGNISKAYKMLVDSLNWRLQNGIDDILAKPIVPVELYRNIRNSQLIGMSGYSNEGHPVFAVGVGMSTYDKASIDYYVQSHIQINEYRDRVILPDATKKYGKHIDQCIKVLDMTGLKLSSLNQTIKFMTTITSIDDQYYPEKTLTYYIVNAPHAFSAYWKVWKPILQERTRKKIVLLSGNGEADLLKIMDYSSLPHFCRKKSSRSSNINGDVDNYFSLDHSFHQQLQTYIQEQSLLRPPVSPLGPVHVALPAESEVGKINNHKRCSESFKDLDHESWRNFGRLGF